MHPGKCFASSLVPIVAQCFDTRLNFGWVGRRALGEARRRQQLKRLGGATLFADLRPLPGWQQSQIGATGGHKRKRLQRMDTSACIDFNFDSLQHQCASPTPVSPGARSLTTANEAISSTD